MPALQVKVTLDEVKVEPGDGLIITAAPLVGAGVGVAVGLGVGVGVAVAVGVGVDFGVAVGVGVADELKAVYV